MVAYGLLLKGYNKYVYHRPIPVHFTAEDIAVVRMVRSVGRVWFAGLLRCYGV